VDDEGPSKEPAEWNDHAALWADFTLHLGVGRELDAFKLELRALFELVGAFISMVGRAVQGLVTRRNR
jgi:hypothetical protein